MTSKPTGRSESIEVIGADANNLKAVDVRFPLKGISVVTGVSGSGKSSLLADTLAAEGSRRVRVFLGVSQQDLERPDVSAFVGPLPPTVLVGQRGFRPSIRTTVGTATGFLAVVRRLFVLASSPYSERAKADVPPPSAESYAAWVVRHYCGEAEVWAAPVRQQRTDGLAAVRRLAQHGVEQVVIRSETDPPKFRETGRTVEASRFSGLNPNVLHTIEALIGAVEITGSSASPWLKEILERAFLAGNGSVVVTLPKAANPDLSGPYGPRLDSTKHWVHPDDPSVFARPTSHLLSFNAPEHADSGACRNCGGTGLGRQLREAALVPHSTRSMNDGAFAIWTEKNYKYVNIQHETVEGLRGMQGFSPDVPWSKLPASARQLILNGSGNEVVFDRDRSGRKFGAARPFPGFRKVILDKSSGGTKLAEQLLAFVEVGSCEACGGSRWSPQARALRVAGHGLNDLLAMTFAEMEQFTAERGVFARAVDPEARSLVEALRRHAHSILQLGLGYLTADRGMLDVSEGESRRIRLARVLDAGESGLCLLLDEPARGLHESDLTRLSTALQRLRGAHTVILNEHRERLWDAADWLIEVGPGAGAAGGEITYSGSPRQRPRSEPEDAIRVRLPLRANHPTIKIRGASIHNVDGVDCDIPVGRLTCITGVSGSGKSSFVRGVLAPALLQSSGGFASDFALRHGRWRSITGAGEIQQVVALDQTMPQPNRRSLVATFTGVFDSVRRIFGASPAAKREGLTASDFGVNAGNGRCAWCAGAGAVADGDLWSPCPSCGGARYGRRALSVRVGGLNVQELLETPIEQLRAHASTFAIPPALIDAVCGLGIGYVALGRRIDTLSGGEVQRLRLAMRLGRDTSGSMLFIMDEPAVGLHARDVQRLAAALERVLDEGRNTVVIVEHDLRLIASADWVIDFGPGSGPEGGKIVFAGTPQDLARAKTPTGLALAGKLTTVRDRSSERKSGTKRKLPLDEQVARTHALLRTLMTGDASSDASKDSVTEPIVVVSDRFWSERQPWEVAGLDSEVPKLLLDLQRVAIADVFALVLETWRKEPSCWLAIQPFLSDMQTWGTALPDSSVRAAKALLTKEGLRLVNTGGVVVGTDADIRDLRATGDRFRPVAESEDARHAVLRDAFAVGAHYVELRDEQGRLRATASDRLVDLKRAIVGPMSPVPSHFMRHDSLGRCPACAGRGVVHALDEALIIANPKRTPDDDMALTREASTVMKGVRQNELKPFLRRLAKEGLWDAGTPFVRLDPSGRDQILFGFWSRPGAGTFLKPGGNPAEVSSWLRWDGLYRRVLEEADRSRDTVWVERVRESARPVACPRCGGSGLQGFAKLLKVGGLSFDEWVRSAPRAMYDAVAALETRSARQRNTKERIVHCLAPLAKARPEAEAAVVKRAVELFTTMDAVDAGVVQES
jgi:excinuclease ABC A subunit